MVKRSRSQTNFSKKIVTIPEFSSASGTTRRNCSALFAILSPTFLNEIGIGIPIPGAPSSQQLLQIKKMMLPYMGNAQAISTCQVSLH